MTIDSPEASRIPALRQLWKDTFSDSDDFLDAFFSTAYSPRRCLCAAEGEKVLGAVYWFRCGARKEKIAYIYALAVGQAHRGRGIGSSLMEKAHALLEEQGYRGVLLVPQEESLVRFYSAMGYRPGTGMREFSCTPGPDTAGLRPVGSGTFARLRRDFLPAGSVIQEGENLAFLETQAELYAGEDFLLAARREGESLFGLELLGNPEAAPSILRALHCSAGTFRTPGDGRSFAMFRPLGNPPMEAPAYFAFAFD